jgi:hypothetical protein
MTVTGNLLVRMAVATLNKSGGSDMSTKTKEPRLEIVHPRLEAALREVMGRRTAKRELEAQEKPLMEEVHSILDEFEGERFVVGGMDVSRVISNRTQWSDFKELLLKRGVDYNILSECEELSKKASVSLRIEESKG